MQYERRPSQELDQLRQEQRKDLPAKAGHVADAVKNLQETQQSRKRPLGAPGGAAPPAAKRLAKSMGVVTEKSAKAAMRPNLPQVVPFSAKIYVIVPPAAPLPGVASASAPGGEAPFDSVQVTAAAAAAGPVYTEATWFKAPPAPPMPPKVPPPALKREYELEPRPDADKGPQPDAAAADKYVRFREQPEVIEEKAPPAKRAKYAAPSPPPAKPPILQYVSGVSYKHILQVGLRSSVANVTQMATQCAL